MLADNTTIHASTSTIQKPNLFIFILCALLFIVLFIGLTGNILVIYVVSNYRVLKTVTNTYLLHLALSDLVFLSGIPFFVSSIITHSWLFGSFACKLFFLTQGVNQYTSIIVLSLLSFDRYLAVCHSAKSIAWRSHVSPNVLIILIWMLSLVLMMPIILFTTLEETRSTVVQCTIVLPLSESRLPYFVYVTYTSSITFFLPLAMMIYFHIRIIRRLQSKTPKDHNRSRASLKRRRKVTILVLTVISIHLLCCTPYWTFQMIATSELLPQTSSMLVPISSLTQFLLFVNSSTNPVLYAFISEVFRTSFKRVFNCCSSPNNHSNTQEQKI